jgi:acyl-CoA synthetase (AMP-forming)/AMP-acid ligase II/acyl carrier protein
MESDPTQRASNQDAKAVLLQALEQLTAELHPHRSVTTPVTLQSSLDRDLGLDSLARVELLARVERRLGVRIPEKKFVEADTPQDLLDEIELAGALGRPQAARTAAPLATGDVDSAPVEATTLVEVLTWHARARPERVHVQFYQDEGEGDTLTYGQLEDGASRVAAGLQQRGLRKGDAVAIMLPTGKDYFFSFMGVLMAGGTPVPIYPPARRAQIEDHLRRHGAILGNCRATTLITVKEAKPLARILEADVASLRDTLTVEELSSRPGRVEPPPIGAEDLAFLQYTSGSTGDPKGVMLSHANLLANIRVMSDTVQADDTDVVVSWLPLYHDMGLIGTWMCSLYNAIPFVLMSPVDFIARPERWFWAIHRHRGTLSAAPNFAYELCLKRLDDDVLEGLDLSSWRFAFNGAESVSPATIERFCERFARFGFRRETLTPVYGLAECSVGLSFPPMGRATMPARSSSSAADDPCADTKSGSWIPPAWSCPTAGRAGSSSAGLPLRRGTSTTRTPPKNWYTAIGWTRGTWATWWTARSSSRDGGKTSSYGRDETSTRRSWRRPSAASRGFVRGTSPFLEPQMPNRERRSWWSWRKRGKSTPPRTTRFAPTSARWRAT